jgi:hypothetical protein
MTKKLNINFTNVTEEGIRQRLDEIASNLYPDVNKDFSESSFGSLIKDSQAYIGAMLYYYVLYNSNESFMDSAIEFENVLRAAKEKGFKYKGVGSVTGMQDFFIIVPANSSGTGPDANYLPILKSQNTTVRQANGELYVLQEDIDFADPKNEQIVASRNAGTGVITEFAVKASAPIRSGELEVEEFEIDDFVSFRKLIIRDGQFTGIVSVIDGNGEVYYEVENMVQTFVYKYLENFNKVNSQDPVNLFEVIPVERRFVVDFDSENVVLTFGGSPDSDKRDTINPSKFAVDSHGRQYLSDTTFNPYDLTQTGKLGVGPENTTLTVVYRRNTTDDPNAAAGEINTIIDSEFVFPDENAIDFATRSSVVGSLETDNPKALTGNIILDLEEEIKIRATGAKMFRNVCVTYKDYEVASYAMPPSFGSIKRVRALLDKDTLRDNINLYIIAEDEDGYLTTASTETKKNLQKWIGTMKSGGDSVDILDATIVNVGIECSIVPNGVDSLIALIDAVETLKAEFSEPKSIGESLKINDVYRVLRSVPTILDVDDVMFVKKSGSDYSGVAYNVDKNMSGGELTVPDNYILEIKFPEEDIRVRIKK